jgi:hypothetical protein
VLLRVASVGIIHVSSVKWIYLLIIFSSKILNSVQLHFRINLILLVV